MAVEFKPAEAIEALRDRGYKNLANDGERTLQALAENFDAGPDDPIGKGRDAMTVADAKDFIRELQDMAKSLAGKRIPRPQGSGPSRDDFI